MTTSEEYLADISTRLLEYCKDGFLCDSIVVAGDKALKAHSVMLAAASPQLKRELDKQMEYEMRYIVLPDMDYETLCVAVYFMYTGHMMLPRKVDESYLAALKASLLRLGLNAAVVNKCHIFYESNRELEFNGVPSSANINTKQHQRGIRATGEASAVTNLFEDLQGKPCNDPFNLLLNSDKNSPVRRSRRINNRKSRNPCSKKRLVNVETDVSKIDLNNYQDSTVKNKSDIVYVNSGRVTDECKTEDDVEGNVLTEFIDGVSTAGQDGSTTCATELQTCSRLVDVKTESEGDSRLEQIKINEWELSEIKEVNLAGNITESEDSLNDYVIENLEATESSSQGNNSTEGACRPRGSVSKKLKRQLRHKCQECLMMFSSQKSLSIHMKSHSLSSSCRRQALGKSNPGRHRPRARRTLPESLRKHECGDCHRKFSVLSMLREHQLDHTGEKAHVCATCGRHFKSASGLKHHMTMSHSSQHSLVSHGSLLCHICGGKFKSRVCLRIHLKRPHVEHVCTDCGKTFYNLSKLSVHSVLEHGTKLRRDPNVNRTHKDVKTPTYLCAFCGYSSSSIKAFSAHRRSHRRICSICSARFEGDSALDDHVRLAHPGESCLPQNWCAVCKKSFSSERSLKEHAMLHTNKRPFVCKTCGKTFASLRVLGSHVRLHCVKIECQANGHELTRKHREQKSMLQSAEPFRQEKLRYSCTECDKVFTSEMSRTAHMATHTGTLPFSCTQCDKKFFYKGYLKTHMLIHTGELPFTCTVCAKGFRQAAHLKTHMHIHEGTKPHSCELCAKGYLSRVDLRNHYSRVHNLDVVRTKINKHHSYTVTLPQQSDDVSMS